MRWLSELNENIKRSVRSWLNVVPASPYNIQINEVMDFETNAIKNRIWYRGDSNELEQMYRQATEYADKYKFWSSKCSSGMEMRKIHTGIPGLIVKILTAIVLTDMNAFDFTGSEKYEELWNDIAKDNDFEEKTKKALREVLYIGDGAFKVTIDTEISQYPILEWYPGERIEIVRRRDRIREVVFKTPYTDRGKTYVLNEHYGYGYIKNELYLEDKQVDMRTIAATEKISDYAFDKSVLLAIPLKVYESTKYEGRGGSIFDAKTDSFDALDEAWSQWMDALRAGRSHTYIPQSLIPNDPETGRTMKPNPFDNRFIESNDVMDENGKNQITNIQPQIPHDSYMAVYCNALDLCLQGIISPSTLGIDVKKLDNADAQREKEKTTLYTRDAIVNALQEVLPKIVETTINAYNILHNKAVEEINVDVTFGEYANPSFESQVETVSKGKQGGIMSIEASIEELYGDTKSEEWKTQEVARLKAEQGIAEMEEPKVGQQEGQFQMQNFLEGAKDAGKNNEPDVPDEPEGISGASKSGK